MKSRRRGPDIPFLKNSAAKIPLMFFFFFIPFFYSYSQESSGSVPFTAGHHRGAVSALYESDGTVLSAGEDGFLGIWETTANGGSAVGRFQLTAFPITAMARRPGREELAVVETDGLGLYRVSVWDYAQKKKFFTLRFKDPVSYISYSAEGGFLIIARSGSTGVVFLDCETGNQLESPPGISGQVTFAVTGKSERSMLCYSPSGYLSYWNLETREELRNIAVPDNMKNPLLFSNNRLFAGFDVRGLVVLDATSGTVVGRSNDVKEGRLIAIDDAGMEFICLDGNSGRVVRYRVGGSGGLEVQSRRSLPNSMPKTSAAVASENNLLIGNNDGRLRLVPPNGSVKTFNSRPQFEIHEAAVSGATLALMNNGGTLAFLPLDYNEYSGQTKIILNDSGAYSRLSPDPSSETGRFLLWYPGNSNYSPMIKTPGGDSSLLSKFSSKSPLSSASVLDDRALFLDTTGNITVLSLENGETLFTYLVQGAMDAAFLDKENIIIGRSAAASSTPFLMINTGTKETVSLAYAASVGGRVYRGGGASVYAAAVNRRGENSVTSIIALDTSSPASSRRLLEYQGEDTSFGMAECSGALATTLGGDGASIFGPEGFVPFERGSGLPVKLAGGKDCFIALDEDGSITWHHSQDGGILAVLRIYQNEWKLELRDGSSLRGAVARMQTRRR